MGMVLFYQLQCFFSIIGCRYDLTVLYRCLLYTSVRNLRGYVVDMFTLGTRRCQDRRIGDRGDMVAAYCTGKYRRYTDYQHGTLTSEDRHCDRDQDTKGSP